ncbi:hypothetical protein CIL05_06980 [Virgibacillus profundi]|uniref:Uncharacterized protein n=1 Tax=Virgibacillus profundi TaxID=2024555 RepID=A0A2A2IGI9_9BACI|nr:hypothetical protein [Virgibacillus profundi]PAV30203.1 hypothetical protein CIL05_06980 [Virgibacillus profundi]PXY54375.1 hypothetical protein CIT14_07065 [Virgibacillus profundi]
MLNTNKKYAIVMFENNAEEKEYIYYGRTENVNHILIKSDASIINIVEVKYFNNTDEMDLILETVRNDFTNDEILEDVSFYNSDYFIEKNNIHTEKMITLYDYNKNIYTLLRKWFHAKNEVKSNLNKDSKGYYIIEKGLNLFNPNKLYLTEKDAKQYHKKEYLNIKLNELKKNKSNWIIKETITEKEFANRCNFLDRMNNVKMI